MTLIFKEIKKLAIFLIVSLVVLLLDIIFVVINFSASKMDVSINHDAIIYQKAYVC